MNNGILPPPTLGIKLSIVTQFYPPDYAATGQLIEELATYLVKSGISIQIFAGQPGYAFQKSFAPAIEASDSLVVRRSRASRLWPMRIRGKALGGLLFFLRSALHILRTAPQYDVLLVTTAPPYLPILGYLANCLFGSTYVCLLYDLYPDVAVKLNVIPDHHWLSRFWTWLNHCTWKRASAIIVLSATMKERIAAKCPGIAHKITVIHSWADPQQIVPIPKQANWFAQQHHLVDRFVVLYSGNMGRCHDLDTIIDAAQRLQHRPVQFVFIGGGAKWQLCRDKVGDLGLSNCLFLPYQEKENLPYSLTACDLSLVSLDRGMEGLIAPSKFYGCLAAGRPLGVICEPHSYLRQILAEAQCGAAFNIGDGAGLANFIDMLSQNPDLATQMGLAGRHYMETHFTLEQIAKQYLQVLWPDHGKPTLSAEPIKFSKRRNRIHGFWRLNPLNSNRLL